MERIRRRRNYYGLLLVVSICLTVWLGVKQIYGASFVLFLFIIILILFIQDFQK